MANDPPHPLSRASSRRLRKRRSAACVGPRQRAADAEDTHDFKNAPRWPRKMGQRGRNTWGFSMTNTALITLLWMAPDRMTAAQLPELVVKAMEAANG